MNNWQTVIEQIEQATVQGFTLVKADQMQGVEKSYFVKLNRVSLLDMFEVEALSLHELAQTKTLRIP
ncbi:hypothetical protein BMR05_06460 [Methylococcaceae bacterium HT4]|nr:hypothetical protein BMR05_06460 [Methylococcaceae bacterium HT4]